MLIYFILFIRLGKGCIFYNIIKNKNSQRLFLDITNRFNLLSLKQLQICWFAIGKKVQHNPKTKNKIDLIKLKRSI